MASQRKSTRKTSRLGLLDSIISIGQWVWGKAATFLGAGAGAGLMGYLAAITDWLNAWGPVAWGTVALATFIILFLAIAGGRRVLAGAKLRRAQAFHAGLLAERQAVNPLDPRFTGVRIALVDLMSPFGEPITDRTFENCELIGPAAALFSGCHFDYSGIVSSEMVKIGVDYFSTTPNKVVFRDCRFINCKFYNLCCLVPAAHADDFAKTVGGKSPWLN